MTQKKDTSGLGRRGKQDEPNGGEWWLKGFESALGRVGSDDKGRNESQNDRLYGGFFVKGESLGGTIGAEGKRTGHKKRKSDAVKDDVTSEPPSSPPHKSPEIKQIPAPQDATEEFIQASAFFETRDRDKAERRRIRREKRNADNRNVALEEFQQIETYLGSRDVEEAERKRRKRAAMRGRESVDGIHTPRASENETKEERHERRKQRRKEKEIAEDETSNELSRDNDTSHQDGCNQTVDFSAEEERLAERKRRKEERRLRRAEKASTMEIEEVASIAKDDLNGAVKLERKARRRTKQDTKR